jgi:orotidine-5'-phosphate decarboxylase
VVALDVPDLDSARALVRALRPLVTWFKVGLELYAVAGPVAVEMVREHGGRVFVDLKLHDIPNTVGRATAALARVGADMLSLHAAGGRAMMAEAVAAAAGGPILLGVTVLTSVGEADLAPLGVARSVVEQVVALARLARDAGLDGWVASPREAALLRAEMGPEPVIVTPGIRPVAGVASWPGGRAGDDQVRVATPAMALAAGADWLVVGRPITRAPDPVQAARALVEEIQRAMEGGAGGSDGSSGRGGTRASSVGDGGVGMGAAGDRGRT